KRVTIPDSPTARRRRRRRPSRPGGTLPCRRSARAGFDTAGRVLTVCAALSEQPPDMVHIIILAIVQGLAELLPVSSSAHVIVAEKLMGLNPAAPEMTLLLVMLHTGTMLAVIVYFWPRWRRAFFSSVPQFRNFAVAIIAATILTGLVGGGIIEFIEKALMRGEPHAWVEQLFDRLDLIAVALAAAGVFILVAGLYENRQRQATAAHKLTPAQYCAIGAIQGLCIPFRGFSRSGATISTGLLTRVERASAEDFSFALAVVLTPPAAAR